MTCVLRVSIEGPNEKYVRIHFFVESISRFHLHKAHKSITKEHYDEVNWSVFCRQLIRA